MEEGPSKREYITPGERLSCAWPTPTQSRSSMQLSAFLPCLGWMLLGAHAAKSNHATPKWETFTSARPSSGLRFVTDSAVCETTPGVGQQSGYIDVAGDASIWYWFYEARHSADTAPLTLWLNGGPGRLLGYDWHVSREWAVHCQRRQRFDDPEPIQVGASPLPHPPYRILTGCSWNNASNLLYMDLPVGAGFSTGSAAVGTVDEVTQMLWDALQILFESPAFAMFANRKMIFATESAHFGPSAIAYFQSQSALVTQGKLSGQKLEFNALMINDGKHDPLTGYGSYISFASDAPGYGPLQPTHVISNMTQSYMETGGCADQLKQCYSAGNGTAADKLCATADNYCTSKLFDPAVQGYNPDYLLESSSSKVTFPPSYYLNYVTSAKVMNAIGANTTFDGCNAAIKTAFSVQGELGRTALPDLAALANAHFPILIWVGDADIKANWLGVHHAMVSMSWYGNLTLNNTALTNLTLGGSAVAAVKTIDSFTFARVYGAGHNLAAYVPSTALYFFNQVVTLVGPSASNNGTTTGSASAAGSSSTSGSTSSGGSPPRGVDRILAAGAILLISHVVLDGTAARPAGMSSISTKSEKQPSVSRSPKPPAAAAPLLNPLSLAWVRPALAKPRTWKTLTRCVVAVAATLVLLVDRTTMNEMGQVAFFGSILASILTPSMAFSLFALAGTLLLLGMLLGWAWSAAAMAAAVAVRDPVRDAQRAAVAAKAFSPDLPASTQLSVLVFHGYFLDARSSAVYGAMFFIGCFAMGVLRARAPKLTLFSIYSTIVMDIMFTFGPLFPSKRYMLAKLFILPSAYYVAIAGVSLLLIFPQSLNHVVLTTLDGAFFGSALTILGLQGSVLSTDPTDQETWSGIAAKAATARAGLAGGLAGVGAQIGMIDMEISIGRLGPTDLKRMVSELRALGFRVSGLLSFQTVISAVHADEIRYNTTPDASAAELGRPAWTHRDGRFAKRKRLIDAREKRHGHTLQKLVPILEEASAPLRAACVESVSVMRGWLEGANVYRWRSFFLPGSAEKQEAEIARRKAVLESTIAKLQTALHEFRTVGRVKLIKPFERFFDASGKLKDGLDPLRNMAGKSEHEMFALRSLYICFVFIDTLDAFAARMLRLLKKTAELDAKRPTPRIWFPTGFGKLWRKLTSRGPSPVDDAPLSEGTAVDMTSFDEREIQAEVEESELDSEHVEEEHEGPQERNPDALPPKNGFERFLVRIGNFLRYFKSPQGIFALRHAVVSLALWVPAVVPRTAWFYYENKGLWALITAQTGLATYAGEQLLTLFMRMTGTIVGMLVGIVVWYIAAPGHGDGNPYAVVIVTTVFAAPFVFGRVFGPVSQMMFWAFSALTIMLVVGYSYLDRHYQQIANPGVGLETGWKRGLLVVVGFVGGSLVMMFPKPTTARMLVRKSLAATLRELGITLASEVEAFLAEEARARQGDYGREEIDIEEPSQSEPTELSPKERRIRRLAARVLIVLERLQHLAPSLLTARWEPQLQGAWPAAEYQKLHALESRFVTYLALLAGALSKLDTKWCSRLVHKTPFMNPNMLSDIFATISILGHSLENGHPVPGTLPCLRERLMYHDSLLHPEHVHDDSSTGSMVQPDDSDGDSMADLVKGKIDGGSIGVEELSLAVLMASRIACSGLLAHDAHFPGRATADELDWSVHLSPSMSSWFPNLTIPPAVVALSMILGVIDDIGVIVRDLCGRTSFRGFEDLHHDFLSKEEAGLGTFAAK
ncbi:unnamed protein product [Mycena citricolor]|uniref:Uncharacterized protein n=1 Tax=Mycena citricolor TaxID=2018698 RepID=A0AAD2H9Y8_9AGAR|nr:unnamed protein product [Mycena citricolor]